jgi:hypothetical protein
MDKAVYAIFENQGAAHEAMNALVREGVPPEVIDLQLQEGELAVEDLPQPATASRLYVKVGVPLVIVVAAVAGALIEGLPGALMGVVGGTVFGGIAAAISGSIEAKPEVADLASEVHDGRIMLVVDVDEVTGRSVALDYQGFLRRHGAVQVGGS